MQPQSLIALEKAGDVCMGLNWIPENESVYLISKGEADSFGVRSSAGKKQQLNCFIRTAEDSTPIESNVGRQVVPSYTISFNGKVAVAVGDYIEIEGQKKIVLTKKEVKDISRTVVITKVTL